MRRLAWDTEFFGIEIARAELDVESPNTAFAAARAAGVDCLYLTAPADRPDLVTDAVSAGARFVGLRLVLAAESEWAAPPAEVRLAGAADANAVEELAAALSSASRFRADGRFDPERVAEMYRTWARACLAEGVVAIADGGFVGVRAREQATTVDLVYVDPARSGRGLGTSLLLTALHAAGHSRATVATQAGNVAAVNLYERAGFRMQSLDATLHAWLDEVP